MIRLSAIDRLGELPTPVRSSGTWATPWRMAWPAIRLATSSPLTVTLPPQGRRPVMTWASSLWPLPATAAMPTISPAATSSETPRRAGRPRSLSAVTSLDREDPGAGLLRRPLDDLEHVPADHPPGEVGGRGLARRQAGGRHLAAAHHRDPVGDGQHLAELVADEHHAPAVGGHRAERPEQLVDLLRGEDGGRLVHDQDPGAAVEQLEDLDPLLLADRQLPDLRPRVDPQAELIGQPGDLSVRLAEVHAEARLVEPEQDVLGDGLRRDQREVLVDHPETGRDRVARRAEFGDGVPSRRIWPASGR